MECTIVTIKMISEACGLSIAAVSKALNGQPGIGQEKAAMVRRTAQEMGYYPNAAAQTLKTKRSFNIGILFQNMLAHEYFSLILESIRQTAEEKNYDITFLGNRHSPGMGYYEHAMYRQCDGVIVAQGNFDFDGLRRLAESEIPVVSVEQTFTGRTAVMSDNVGSMEAIVQYLHGLGHREILYFGRRRGSTTHQLRSEGYAAACQELGLTPQYCNNTFPLTSIKYGYQLAKQLFAQERHFTAIFAATDTNALGVIQAAEESGVRIPEDVSLLGFDNIRYSSLPRINLTTIEQPMKMLASVAVDSLLDKIQSELAGYNHRILMPALIERASCCPPK